MFKVFLKIKMYCLNYYRYWNFFPLILIKLVLKSCPAFFNIAFLRSNKWALRTHCFNLAYLVPNSDILLILLSQLDLYNFFHANLTIFFFSFMTSQLKCKLICMTMSREFNLNFQIKCKQWNYPNSGHSALAANWHKSLCAWIYHKQIPTKPLKWLNFLFV